MTVLPGDEEVDQERHKTHQNCQQSFHTVILVECGEELKSVGSLAPKPKY